MKNHLNVYLVLDRIETDDGRTGNSSEQRLPMVDGNSFGAASIEAENSMYFELYQIVCYFEIYVHEWLRIICNQYTFRQLVKRYAFEGMGAD